MMENVLCSSHDIIDKGISWPNVLNAEKKSPLQRRHGRWLEELTKPARKQNSQSDSLSTAEKVSDPH